MQILSKISKCWLILSFLRLAMRSDFENIGLLVKTCANESCISSLIEELNKFVYSHSKISPKEILLLLQQAKEIIENRGTDQEESSSMIYVRFKS